MARFTATVPLKIRWNGLSFEGDSGTTYRLPDEYADEFVEDVAGRLTGFAWVSQDESTSDITLPIAQANVTGLTAALAAKADQSSLTSGLALKVNTAGGSVTGTLNVATLYAKGGQWVDVKAHGAVGDNSTDDTAAIGTALAAVPAGGILYFPPGTYVVSAALAVTAAMTLMGGTIRQATASTIGINVQADDVTIRGVKVTRTSTPGSDQLGSNAINIVGSAASAPRQRVRVIDCEISNFNRYGIYAEHLVGFEFRGNFIHDIWYAGVMVLSTQQGSIANNVITDIEGSISSNAYGISVSRNETASLTTEPRSSDITIVGNVIKNVTIWEGIDTHGGERLTIAGNSVYDCPTGIAVVPSDTPTDVETYAPLDVTVIGNTVVWSGTAGSASYGINFAGAGSASGAVIQYGTGAIIGNSITRHGLDSSSSATGGIRFRATRGMTVAGNNILEPANHGIVVQYENIGFSVTGNQVIDPWSNGQTTNVSGVATRGTVNKGFIGGNAVALGTKTATTVLNFGIRLQSDTASSAVHIGTNYLDEATVRVSDGAADSRARVEASKIGLYGATPVTRQVVTGSRSTGAALTSLLTALDALGAITNSSSA